MTVTLAKLSICPCGFFLIAENVPIGTRYEIIPFVVAPTTVICGGCGRQIHTEAVYAVSREGKPNKGWIPRDVFALPKHHVPSKNKSTH